MEFAVIVGAGLFLMIIYRVQAAPAVEIPTIHGTLQFENQIVRTPAEAGLPLDFALSIDRFDNVVTHAKLDGANSGITTWNSKSVPNGDHTLIFRAYLGKQLLGEDSRRAIVSN